MVSEDHTCNNFHALFPALHFFLVSTKLTICNTFFLYKKNSSYSQIYAKINAKHKKRLLMLLLHFKVQTNENVTSQVIVLSDKYS